jgi:hypothetical protein
MAKKTKRSKVVPPKQTPSEQEREAIKLALKRAVRREKEIQLLTKRLDRMEQKTARGLAEFVSKHAVLIDPAALPRQDREADHP